jgi:DNA invertase Pin-like site-specific DNA recombinase
VFGAIAHFERRLIGERTKDGLAAAKAKGRRPGRPPIDPDKGDAAFKLIEAGLSPIEAARQVGLDVPLFTNSAPSDHASLSRQLCPDNGACPCGGW